MPETASLGEISAVTGSCMKGPQRRNRCRNIGSIMLASHSTGGKCYRLRLDAGIPHSSLYALLCAAGMKPGDSSSTATVFEPRVAL
jgi:hypothetical protein